MLYLDSTKAVIPPLSGTNVPGQRSAQRLQSGAAALTSRKMTHGRIYNLVVGAQAVRCTWRGDDSIAAASGVSSTLDFLIPANTIFSFLSFAGEKNTETKVPQYGSQFLYIVGDGGAAFECFLYEAGR